MHVFNNIFFQTKEEKPESKTKGTEPQTIERKTRKTLRKVDKEATTGEAVEENPKSGTKNSITEFTVKSMRNLKFTLRNALCVWNCCITLTYPLVDFPTDGREWKRHLNLFLNHLRRDYNGFKYVWFLEFKEQGAPLFHIFSTSPIPGSSYVSPLWYSIVGSKDIEHLQAGTNVKAFSNGKEAPSLPFLKKK